MSKNVYTIDASTLDTGGTIVPTAQGDDPFGMSTTDKEEWEVKIYNNSDQEIDAQALGSTSDDAGFDEYFEVDGATVTVASGGTVPGSVEYIDADVIAAYLGVELTPAAAATGSVKVVFQTRSMA